MPQYELMYLLASSVADDQVPGISEQVKKFVEDFGGTEIKETLLGKKKLAYPIKRTRNGHYVVVNFQMEGKNLNLLDARIRSQDANIIRYIIINMDEHLLRLEKDKVAQAKLSKRPQTEETAPGKPAPLKIERKEKEPAIVPAAPLVEIDSEALDKKIEEALSEDLTK